MNINSVRLNGTKGLIVKYMIGEESHGLTFLNEYSTVYRMPVHEALKNLFAKLAPHLVSICKIDVDNDPEYSDIEITGITSNGGDFLISAKISTLNGSTFAINTPLVKEESDYYMHDAVIKIVNDIYSEIKIYADKKRKPESKQFVMDFYKNVEGYTQEMFDSMSEGESRELMVAALEKSGAIIIDREDMEVDTVKIIEMDTTAESKKKKVAVN